MWMAHHLSYDLCLCPGSLPYSTPVPHFLFQALTVVCFPFPASSCRCGRVARSARKPSVGTSSSRRCRVWWSSESGRSGWEGGCRQGCRWMSMMIQEWPVGWNELHGMPLILYSNIVCLRLAASVVGQSVQLPSRSSTFPSSHCFTLSLHHTDSHFILMIDSHSLRATGGFPEDRLEPFLVR